MKHFNNHCFLFVLYVLIQTSSAFGQEVMDEKNVFDFSYEELTFRKLTKVHGFSRVEDLDGYVLRRQISKNIQVSFVLHRKKPVSEEIVIKAHSFSRQSLDSLMVLYNFYNLTPLCMIDAQDVETLPGDNVSVEPAHYRFTGSSSMGYQFMATFYDGKPGDVDLRCYFEFPIYFRERGAKYRKSNAMDRAPKP
jgi:hypothetical protein